MEIRDRPYFNPRSHEGSDTLNALDNLIADDFNPRSHEGSDNVRAQGRHNPGISIHAPTKGATPVSMYSVLRMMISIHAPTKGATRPETAEHRQRPISIHAPTKGATGNGISDNPEGKFQSTLPRRERLRGYNHSCFFKYFNPRSHEGSDTFRTGCHSTYSHFNPRSHEGSDEQHLIMLSNYKKFQSTLPRRERRPPVTIPDHEFSISIHAPTKGATSLDLRRNPRPEDFNPRSHEGSD